jgi:putative glutamine amidotransferase
MSDLPTIGITVSTAEPADPPAYRSAAAYADAVAAAGALPVLLPQQPALAGAYVAELDGVLLTGGDDPATEAFGAVTDARARLITARRQAFELALLGAAAADRPGLPMLGVCLGMQLMALHAGGELDQYMPDTLGGADAAAHQGDRPHRLVAEPDAADSPLVAAGFDPHEPIVSAHRQAVADPGAMRVVALAPDGTVEAIDDPTRPWYVGVQWHPERGGDRPLSSGLIGRFVDACRAGETL